MSDEAKPRSWWHTLPGVLAGVAALVTAVAGLLAAVMQTGWFGQRSAGAPATATTATAPVPDVAPPRSAAPSTTATSAATTKPAPTTAGVQAVELPDQRDYTLGSAASGVTYALLRAETAPRTADRRTLRIHLRMTNHGRYDQNFWDRSFRLLVDAVPVAPESELNELVAGGSAREGEIVFAVPRDTRDVRLRISYGDDATDVPLALGR